MYCPRCNQQQVSDEVRFCSRCGLRLDVVATLLKHGALETHVGQAPKNTARRRRRRQGAKMMFISAFLLPVAIGLSAAAHSPGPLFIPFLLFLFGLFWMLYFRIFGEDTAQAEEVYRPPQ